MLKHSWIQSDWLDEFDEEPEIDSDYVNDLINLNVTLDNYMQLIKFSDYIQVKNVDVLIDAIVQIKNIHCVTEFEDFYKLSPRLKPLTREKLKEAVDHWVRDEVSCFMTYGHVIYWDVSNVTNMNSMFENSEFNGDISKWDVSNVINMNAMFDGSKFDGDISDWDVSKVTDMIYMFENSVFNVDISKWDVSNVTDMGNMFKDSKFNGDISKWDVSNVTGMCGMFKDSKFNGDISKWDVSKVTDMCGMFHYSTFNGDISKWDVSKCRIHKTD